MGFAKIYLFRYKYESPAIIVGRIIIGKYLNPLFLDINHSISTAGKIKKPNGLVIVASPENIPDKIHFSFLAAYIVILKISKNKDSV
jgi:hypothetical protein